MPLSANRYPRRRNLRRRAVATPRGRGHNRCVADPPWQRARNMTSGTQSMDSASPVADTPAAPTAPLFELRGISKQFPSVKALDDVSFEIRAGEVHMLLGENGAGKSTLMKVLCGAYRADAGAFFHRGEPVDHRHARRRAADRHRRHLPGIHPRPLSRHRPEHLSRPRVQGPHSRADRSRAHLRAKPSASSTRSASTSIRARRCTGSASPSSRWSRSPRRCRRTRASW